MNFLVSALLALGFVASSGFADGGLKMEGSAILTATGGREGNCRTFRGPNAFVVVDKNTGKPKIAFSGFPRFSLCDNGGAFRLKQQGRYNAKNIGNNRSVVKFKARVLDTNMTQVEGIVDLKPAASTTCSKKTSKDGKNEWSCYNQAISEW